MTDTTFRGLHHVHERLAPGSDRRPDPAGSGAHRPRPSQPDDQPVPFGIVPRRLAGSKPLRLRGVRGCLLALATAVMASACAGPSGTHLSQLKVDPVSTLLPPGSVIFWDGSSDLHGGISGKQRAGIIRYVASSTPCPSVLGFYTHALSDQKWATGTGPGGTALGDVAVLGWVKGPLSFGVSTVDRSVRGNSTPAGPPAVNGAPVICTFRTDMRGS